MGRLTKKDIENIANSWICVERLGGKTMSAKILQEMYEYKSIEEGLGIDLITYIKLVQNGFFGICEDDEHDKPYVFEFLPRDFVAYSDEIVVYWENSEEEYTTYQYKDYGKTWALTKEELENEKINN